MSDPFEEYTSGLSSPARNAFAITPNDSVDLAITPRFLNITVAGNIKVDTLGGDTGITLAVPVGRFDLRATRVYAIGTTATGIVGLY
jgi:hypothetical protein